MNNEVFKCSKTTVHKIKDSGALDGYIFQVGRTISGYEDEIIKGGVRCSEALKKQKKNIKKPSNLRR